MWRKTKNIFHLVQAYIANIYYGFPSKKLTVIGVTGTSGKTTTALMIYQVLKDSGHRVSVLTTIKGVIGGKEYDTGFHVTTPDPLELPKYLKQALDKGDTYFVIEVSSHALDQNRAAFIPFKIGVLTTLAHEHLDYHRTYANYAKAKFKLLFNSEVAVFPDDLICSKQHEVEPYLKLISTKKNIKTFGFGNADENQKNWNFNLKIPGDYMIKNALAAAAVGKLLGIDKKNIKKSLENYSNVSGRFEEIPNNLGFTIINDFAHKPDALEAVLKVARKIVKKNGRVISMYGSAGKRDILKRAMMGKISGQLADITVITDEDPRFEDPMKIINEIAEGCIEAGAKECQISKSPTSPRLRGASKFQMSKNHIFYKIHDRGEAIDFIINKLARKDDIILLCGKGHEQSMNYQGIESPWSENGAVMKALGKKVSKVS